MVLRDAGLSLSASELNCVLSSDWTLICSAYFSIPFQNLKKSIFEERGDECGMFWEFVSDFLLSVLPKRCKIRNQVESRNSKH